MDLDSKLSVLTDYKTGAFSFEIFINSHRIHSNLEPIISIFAANKKNYASKRNPQSIKRNTSC